MGLILPAALVGSAAAAALYLLWKKHGAHSGPEAPSAPGARPSSGPPGSGPELVGPGGKAPPGTYADDVPLDPDVRAHLDRMIAVGRDPDAMGVVADTLDSLGYASDASDVRAAIARLKSAPSPSPSPAPTPAAPAAPVDPTVARVTTHDPPPQGDLIVWATPARTTKAGGAEKDGTVQVLEWHAGDGTWAKIAWSGGSRWPAVVGYVAKAYLTPLDAVSGRGRASSDPTFARYQKRRNVAGRMLGEAKSCLRVGLVRWPGGLVLRSEPSDKSRGQAIAAAAGPAAVLREVPGPKRENGPGPGGWSLVATEQGRGWVPAEWVA